MVKIVKHHMSVVHILLSNYIGSQHWIMWLWNMAETWVVCISNVTIEVSGRIQSLLQRAFIFYQPEFHFDNLYTMEIDYAHF